MESAKREVVELQGKLQKAVKSEDADLVIDLLEALKAVPMSLDILRDTRIGASVAPLKKWEAEIVSQKAKALIKHWRTIAGNPKSPRSQPKAPPQRAASTSDEASEPSRPSKPSAATDSYTTEVDAQRSAVREKMRKILSVDDKGSTPLFLVAQSIEEAMFSFGKGDKKVYGDKFRQLAFNLPKNQDLREELNRGQVTPEQLVQLTPNELAPRDVQARKAKMALEQHEARSLDWLAKNDEAIRAECGLKEVVGMYTCGRCKSQKIKNSEAQTRSADEPMTQFFSCLDCHNRWRF